VDPLGDERTSLGVSFPSACLTRAATCIGLASPDCAAPSGFLNLVTLSSARAATALFRAVSTHGICSSQRFPPPSGRHGSRRACPSGPRPRAETRDSSFGDHAPGRSVHAGPVLPETRRPSLSQPSTPSKGFSHRVSASHRCKASSLGLFHNAGHVQRHGRSPEFQRTRKSEDLLRDQPPFLGF
jgi:hypothetical protein